MRQGRLYSSAWSFSLVASSALACRSPGTLRVRSVIINRLLIQLSLGQSKGSPLKRSISTRTIPSQLTWLWLFGSYKNGFEISQYAEVSCLKITLAFSLGLCHDLMLSLVNTSDKKRDHSKNRFHVWWQVCQSMAVGLKMDSPDASCWWNENRETLKSKT
jgi:hypothetical protein